MNSIDRYLTALKNKKTDERLCWLCDNTKFLDNGKECYCVIAERLFIENEEKYNQADRLTGKTPEKEM